jgi:hypothetical protein
VRAASKEAEGARGVPRVPQAHPGPARSVLSFLFFFFFFFARTLTSFGCPEFIGWYGTNSDTAQLWAKNGYISKPTAKTGLFDFNFFGPKTAGGTSNADAELGPGLYVTDEQGTCVDLVFLCSKR